MDKTEFEAWKESLEKDKQREATGFFSVIKRHSEFCLDSDISDNKVGDEATSDLYISPYSQAYKSLLAKASELLPELDLKLDVTIGPYETYTDKHFGYKATSEAFIGVQDEEASAQLKLFGDTLQVLEQNLPLDKVYKSDHVNAAPIRIIQLIYNAGDVRGPQIVAFNLPNDERMVKDRGASMVMLKNVHEAKFNHILLPIAEVCVAKEQQELVDFESFFTHTICHECCHGIGPHSITLPNGQKSTVRLELQEFHSAMEEAKADIVGLWAPRFLIHKGLLSESLLKSIYVSFLAGCFRSVRFGLEEAHGSQVN
ncbi:hypothetical protein K1719_033507 [Acacia pycnantha]|nr:hypothetical protein K1719_033507 [Acacia pycnantha]